MRQITATASFVIDYDPAVEDPEEALALWIGDYGDPVGLFEITDDQEKDDDESL